MDWNHGDQQDERVDAALERAQRRNAERATLPDTRLGVVDREMRGVRLNATLAAVNEPAAEDHVGVTYLSAAASQMVGWTKDDRLGEGPHEMIDFQQHAGTALRVNVDRFEARGGTVSQWTTAGCPRTKTHG